MSGCGDCKRCGGCRRNASSIFPYGECQCSEGIPPGCCQGKGPAAYQVEREARSINVCTHCRLSSDDIIKLLVTPLDDIQLFMDYDRLGGLEIYFRLQDQMEQNPLRHKR